MVAPTTDLQIAAALAENVYRRDNGDQQIQFADIDVDPVTNLPVAGLTPQAGYYYNNTTGFVGSVTTKGNTAFITFRGTDWSGDQWDIADNFFTSPAELVGYATPGSFQNQKAGTTIRR